MKALEARWRALWQRTGAAGEPPWELLASAWTQPWRHYHTLAHLAHCLRELDGAEGLAGDPDAVEAALFFHDVVYRPERVDNETASADLAQQVLANAGLPALAAKVWALVLSTRHDATPEDDDARLLNDVDLAILGASPARFDRYERDVRAEYAFVPEDLWRAGRGRILHGFLARPRIYSTDRFAARYEAAARANLTRALERLA
ncbi:MAG: N-methyl-D-aspartate receptor NMDAR2C subunit [Myxococcota bacterium]